MPEAVSSAADLRQRLAHHATTKANAEARRASIFADRASAIAVLTSAELDEMDDEADHLAVVIERAASRMEALQPALTAAETRDAEADALARRAADNAAFAVVNGGMMAALAGSPEKAKSAAVAALAARAPEVEYSSTIFDLPPPQVQVHVDLEEWHRQREERLRAEGLSTGTPPVSRAPLTSMEMSHPHLRG